MRIKWQVAQMESSSPTPLFVSLTHAHGLPHLGRFSHSTHTAPLGGDERKGSLARRGVTLPLPEARGSSLLTHLPALARPRTPPARLAASARPPAPFSRAQPGTSAPWANGSRSCQWPSPFGSPAPCPPGWALAGPALGWGQCPAPAEAASCPQFCFCQRTLPCAARSSVHVISWVVIFFITMFYFLPHFTETFCGSISSGINTSAHQVCSVRVDCQITAFLSVSTVLLYGIKLH